jgi:hypothetical protein
MTAWAPELQVPVSVVRLCGSWASTAGMARARSEVRANIAASGDGEETSVSVDTDGNTRCRKNALLLVRCQANAYLDLVFPFQARR